MKKLMSIALALVLTLSMMALAFAAPQSPVAIAAASGKVELMAPQEMPKGATNTASAVETATELGVEKTETLVLVATMDYEGVEGENTMTIPAAAGKYVVLLHYVNGAWEVAYEGYANADGSFDFVLESSSPFALLIEEAPNGGDNGKTSPQTDDSAMVGVWVAVSALCLLGGAYVIRRGKKA